MGCDIHVLAERYRDLGHWQGWERIYPCPEDRDPEYVKWARKLESGDVFWSWVHVQAYLGWWSDRNYPLFGILAGVRGDGPPIAEPRGLPIDLGLEGREWADPNNLHSQDISYGDHSASWLTLQELQENRDRLLEAAPDFERVLRGLAKLGLPDRVRIVFNFDS